MTAPKPSDQGRFGPQTLVVHGGRILTSARSGTFVEAMAVSGGRVVAVGTSEDVRAQASAGIPAIDLGGRTVVPGLIDSHIHALRAGLTWDTEVRWDGLLSLDEALERVARAAASRPPGTWVTVLGGWHPAQFAEARRPTRQDLDRVAPEHPCVAQLLYDGVVVNSAALGAVTGLGADRSGWAAGMGAVQRCTQALGDRGLEGEKRATRAFLGDLSRWGLTCLIDAAGFGMTRDRYRAALSLAEDGELPLRLRLYVGAATAGAEEDEIEGWLAYMRSHPGDEWLSAVGIGEIAVFECHDGEGLDADGFPPAALARLEAITRRVARAGRSLQLHAIRDSSVSAILDVWERVDRDVPLAGLRFTLAHVEQISRRNLERVAALGVGLAVQSRLALRAADTAEVWGADALRSTPPLRTMLDLGIPVAAGTDATRVAAPNPWSAMAWLVSGRHPDGGPARDPAQCLSLLEALEAYTEGSARMSGEAADLGRLEPGYRADFAVLSADCFALAAEDLPAVGSVLTVVGGRPVSARADFAHLLQR